MIIELLYILFVLLSFLIIFIVLLQKSKGSLGLSGALGGQTQAMFGGSGGQDFFQKTTWVFVACFMAGSLFLAILKNRAVNVSRYFSGDIAPLVAPQQPESATAEKSATADEMTTQSPSTP